MFVLLTIFKGCSEIRILYYVCKKQDNLSQRISFGAFHLMVIVFSQEQTKIRVGDLLLQNNIRQRNK